MRRAYNGSRVRDTDAKPCPGRLWKYHGHKDRSDSASVGFHNFLRAFNNELAQALKNARPVSEVGIGATKNSGSRTSLSGLHEAHSGARRTPQRAAINGHQTGDASPIIGSETAIKGRALGQPSKCIPLPPGRTRRPLRSLASDHQISAR
jgi:hypothetical protein